MHMPTRTERQSHTNSQTHMHTDTQECRRTYTRRDNGPALKRLVMKEGWEALPAAATGLSGGLGRDGGGSLNRKINVH